MFQRNIFIDVNIFQGYRRGDYLYQKDLLSPPSSVARLSDSDTSEFDIDDGISSVTGNIFLLLLIDSKTTCSWLIS